MVMMELDDLAVMAVACKLMLEGLLARWQPF